MADDKDPKSYLGEEPDYMRRSGTRVGVGSFDFSLIYPQRDLQTISDDEQRTNYIADCLNKAAQQELEAQIEVQTEQVLQIDEPTYQNYNKRPPYNPVGESEPVSLPHRVPAFPIVKRGTVGDLVDRVKKSLRDVDIKSSRSRDSRFSMESDYSDLYTSTDKSEVV